MDTSRFRGAILTRAATSAQYGGRFVPETLVEPIEELERAYFAVRDDPAFARGAEPAAQGLRRPPDAGLRDEAPDGGRRRRAHLPQARRPHAHGRAQDQQRARSGAAGRPHGQAADRRGDRRRPARRRHRDGVRAARPRVPRLHGQRGHGSAGAQRLSHAAARRRSLPRRRRQPYAEGCDQRGDARLGDQRRRHLLPPGIGARSASVSADGSRVPVGDRPRGARADSRDDRRAARPRSSPASAAAAMPWASSTRSSTIATSG